MKSDFQARPSGRRGGARSALPGAAQFMSERQTQAYLLARDTIRRIQRTSSMFDSGLKDTKHALGTGNGPTQRH